MNLQKYGHASKAGPFVWGLWYCCHFIYWFRNNLLQQVCLALISLQIRYQEAWLMAKGFHNKEGILRLLMSGRDLMAVSYTNGEGTCTGTSSLPLLRSWCKGIFPLYGCTFSFGNLTSSCWLPVFQVCISVFKTGKLHPQLHLQQRYLMLMERTLVAPLAAPSALEFIPMESNWTLQSWRCSNSMERCLKNSPPPTPCDIPMNLGLWY